MPGKASTDPHDKLSEHKKQTRKRFLIAGHQYLPEVKELEPFFNCNTFAVAVRLWRWQPPALSSSSYISSHKEQLPQRLQTVLCPGTSRNTKSW